MTGSRGHLDSADQVDVLQFNYLATPVGVRLIGKTRHHDAHRFGILFCDCEGGATAAGGQL